MVEAVSKQLEGGTRTVALVGRLDDPQLRSSVRLFEKVSKGGWDIKVHDVCTRTLAALEEDPDEGDVCRSFCLLQKVEINAATSLEATAGLHPNTPLL